MEHMKQKEKQMAKYEIRWSETETYRCLISAESPEQAEQEFWAIVFDGGTEDLDKSHMETDGPNIITVEKY
jgi:hypothetical protein